MEWDIVIGLEVHIQLLTNSKIFSGAATDVGAEPNTQACIIDLGLPGVLPVLNKDAVKMAVKFGLAINADICKRSFFARKNYFYPDLPKGYQISQHHHPIVGAGSLNITLDDGSTKRINIVRAHLEEDAGKSLHEDFHGMTGVDLNRAGVPLLEIVSAPDLSSAEEAIAYLKSLHTLVRYLEICDGNMQDGSFRCDVNISVKPKGDKIFGTRAEVKNMNSFRFIERAIHFEAERQINILTAGGKITQETRLFDSVKNETRGMRAKEEANDYRYFPEPDLLPVELTDEWIDAIKKTLPELPQQKYQRFIKDYKLTPYDANSLIIDEAMSNYFEKTLELIQGEPKLVANWMMGELTAALNKTNIPIDQSPITEAQFAGLLKRIADHTISGNIAKTVFEAIWAGEGDADAVIEAKGLKQITDNDAIEALIKEVLATSPAQVAEYRSGKTKLFGFFVGKVMQASKGKANPEQINQRLKVALDTQA